MDTYFYLYLSITILILIIFLIIFMIKCSSKSIHQSISLLSDGSLLQNQNDVTYNFNKLPFPYRNFIDEHGNILNIVGITAFFRNTESKILYYKLQVNNLIIGVTAYKTFPRHITDVAEDKFHITDDFDYINNSQLWLTCFSEPNDFGIKNKPILNLSESDFYDIDNAIINNSKKYDFIYICNKDDNSCNPNGWNAISRNFSLAQRCFPIMCNELGLKGLIVGRINCGLEEKYPGKIEVTDFLEWNILQNKMRECRFVFVPNIYDASPRIIGECISKGLYLLINRNIMGGIKYVSKHTGYSFLDEHDIKYWLKKLLNKMNKSKYDPKKWWGENYGKLNSGKKLRDFIFQYYPEKVSHCRICIF